MRKTICVLVIVFIVTTLIVIFFIINNNKKYNNNLIVDEIITNEENKYIEFDDFNEMGLYLAKKNGDWSKFHLSKEFRKKYNEKNGIFGNMKFDNVEYKPYHDGKYSFEDYSYLVVTQGKKKTAYTFSLINTGDGYNIEFYNIIELVDENGFDLDAKIIINKENFGNSFRKLSRGSNDEQSIAVTNNFHKKYPHFLDLFIHYSPPEFNRIKFLEDRSSFDKKEAYFEVDSELECKIRTYKVKFKLDEKGYLDDADVELLEEERYAGNSQNTGNKIFYKNSNWDNIKITNNFKNNHKKSISTFQDIDELDNNFSFSKDEYVAYTIIPHEKSICGFKFKDGKFRYYLKESKLDNNNYFDECIYIKLPYENMTIEEVKELYLKSISE